MPTPSLLQRLKERKLFQWGIAYLCGAWVFVEATNLVVEQFSWPQLVGQVVTILAFFGFFVVLVLAWYHGEKGRQKVSGPELLMVAALLVVAGVALATVRTDRGSGEGERPRVVGIAATSEDRPTIAVLPLENFSPDPANSFFADGMQEEIISTLSKISGLKVISRSSVMQYTDERPPIRQIAAELGAGSIVEGSASIAGGSVRLTVQLIDGTQDEHLWSHTYDRPYSVEELFSIQSDLAQQIAESLNATLLPEEVRRVAALPTRDTVAYNLFLRAREFVDLSSEADHETSMELLRLAIRLDPGFAAAYAVLAEKHFGRIQNFGYPVLWADTVVSLAEKALELDPELALGHFALSLGYHVQRRFEERNAAEIRAHQLNPSFAAPMNSLGLDAFDLGHCDVAYEWLRRANEVRPGDPGILTNFADASFCLGLEDEGLRYLFTAAEVDPDRMYVLQGQIFADVRASDLESARELAEAWVQRTTGEPLALLTAGQVAMVSRDPGGARAHLEGLLLRAPNWPIGLRPAEMRSDLAWALMEEGEREGALGLLEESRRWLEETLAGGNPEPKLFIELAATSALRDEVGRALEELDQVLASGGPSWPWMVPLDPRFDGLRSHPRFQAFADRLQAHVDSMRDRVERGEVDLGIGG